MARRGRPKGRRGPTGPNPIDIHVGSRVRFRRTILGLSQEKLAEAIGLTFQQVQKYERGANRIGCSRLFDISRVLSVPVGFFFEEMPSGVADSSPARRLGGWSEGEQETFEHKRDPMLRRETLELVRAYYNIKNLEARKGLFEVTKAISHADRLSRGETITKRGGRPRKNPG